MDEENWENKIKEYILKFKTPEKFINKILSSIKDELSIIKVEDYSIQISNKKDLKNINKEEIEFMEEVAKRKKELKREYSIKGSKTIEISLTPILNNQGKVVEIIKTSKDITKSKKIMEELQKVKNKLSKSKKVTIKKGDNIKIKKQELSENKKLKKEISELTKANFSFKEELEKLSNKNKTLQRKFEEKKSSPRKKLQKKVKEKSKLNYNEKLVLYGICSYPLLNDEQISKKIKIKRSTLTSIKNRLKKQGWFKILYLPNINVLNCDILALLSMELKSPFETTKITSNMPNELLILNENSEKMQGFFVSESYNDLEKFTSNLSLDLNHLLKSEIQKYLFLKGVDKINYSYFSSIIKDIFNLEIHLDKETNQRTFDIKTKKMTNNEKRIFFEIIQYPELPLTQLAKKIWISKPTIIKKRKKLLDENLIIPYVIPNLEKLGINISATITTSFNQKTPEIKIPDIEENTILKITKNNEIIRHMFFSDENELNSTIKTITQAYSDEDIIPEINTSSFKLKNAKKIKKPELVDLTEKLLF